MALGEFQLCSEKKRARASKLGSRNFEFISLVQSRIWSRRIICVFSDVPWFLDYLMSSLLYYHFQLIVLQFVRACVT